MRKSQRHQNKIRRLSVPFFIALCINQSHGFIVGHEEALRCTKLHYSTRSTIEETGKRKVVESISQDFDSQTIESILPPASKQSESTSRGNDEASCSVSVSSSQSTKIKARRSQEPRPFPFSMIVDQHEIKHALLLSAVNPISIGGVLISGGRGTAKSVLARSMEKIVPQYIRRIEGSEYNIDPEGRYGVDSFLLQQLQENGSSFEQLRTETVPTPFVQIPLGCMEDSLIGTVDLEQSLDTGVAKFSPGLLAKSHRG